MKILSKTHNVGLRENNIMKFYILQQKQCIYNEVLFTRHPIVALQQ